jgi:enamine deaminase RidA (YjgF/YER057c/UK114 family)
MEDPLRNEEAMFYRYRMAIVMGLTLLAAAACAGSDTPREPFPSGGMIPPPSKQGMALGIPWEKQFGTKGAVRMRDMIFIAAQLSWDERGIVTGDTMEAQMRHAYANIGKLLEPHGAKFKDIVEETVFVTNMKDALAAAQKVRQEVFGEAPTVASSLVEVTQLADPKAHVAISAVAQLDISMGRGPGSTSSGSRPRGGGSRSRGGMGGGLTPF